MGLCLVFINKCCFGYVGPAVAPLGAQDDEPHLGPAAATGAQDGARPRAATGRGAQDEPRVGPVAAPVPERPAPVPKTAPRLPFEPDTGVAA